jgi:uncharacterized protein YcfL
MKTFFIFIITFSFCLAGCSSSQDTASKKNMQIVNATFSSWSESPQAGSDIPERGVDLKVTIRNWPQEYQPNYIAYDGRKSLSVTLSDSTNNSVTVTGRIVRTSGVLAEISESIDVSDRLVFTDQDGDTGFIEIDNWQRSDK